MDALIPTSQLFKIKHNISFPFFRFFIFVGFRFLNIFVGFHFMVFGWEVVWGKVPNLFCDLFGVLGSLFCVGCSNDKGLVEKRRGRIFFRGVVWVVLRVWVRVGSGNGRLA